MEVFGYGWPTESRWTDLFYETWLDACHKPIVRIYIRLIEEYIWSN